VLRGVMHQRRMHAQERRQVMITNLLVAAEGMVAVRMAASSSKHAAAGAQLGLNWTVCSLVLFSAYSRTVQCWTIVCHIAFDLFGSW
jgi:predicted membrane-bound mannosyltransferase